MNENAGKEGVSRQLMVSLQQFVGPIPPPETMRQYEEVLPGLPDRIIAMAEREQAHRHAQAAKELEIDGIVATARTKEIRLGQCLGFGAVLLTLIAGVVLTLCDHPTVGTIIGSSGLVGLVSVFIMGRDGKPQNHPKAETAMAQTDTK